MVNVLEWWRAGASPTGGGVGGSWPPAVHPAPLFSGNFEVATRKLVRWYS